MQFENQLKIAKLKSHSIYYKKNLFTQGSLEFIAFSAQFQGFVLLMPFGRISASECMKDNNAFLRLVQNEKKVHVGKDQEKAQSEKDSHSKNRGGKKPN